MKITCECGHQIIDTTDKIAYKGHIIADQDWDTVLDYIDDILTKLAAGRTREEAASMSIRKLLISQTRHVWQCTACGSIYADDWNRELNRFVPAQAERSKNILSRNSRLE